MMVKKTAIDGFLLLSLLLVGCTSAPMSNTGSGGQTSARAHPVRQPTTGFTAPAGRSGTAAAARTSGVRPRRTEVQPTQSTMASAPQEPRNPRGNVVASGADSTESGRPEKNIPEDVSFGAQRESLIDSLNQARSRARERSKELESLTTALREAQTELKTVKAERDGLERDLEARNAEVKELRTALKEWKQNVLGYREKMREAEKAEMQALKQIIVLLQKARKASAGNQKQADRKGEGQS